MRRYGALLLAVLVTLVGAAAAFADDPGDNAAYGYDGAPAASVSIFDASADTPGELGDRGDQSGHGVVRNAYDDRSQLAGASARPGGYRWAAETEVPQVLANRAAGNAARDAIAARYAGASTEVSFETELGLRLSTCSLRSAWRSSRRSATRR